MLCFRCEYRIAFLEAEYMKKNGRGPRFECTSKNTAVNSCYMFKPAKPITLEPNEGDNRPITLNILSARVHKADEQVELVADAYIKDSNTNIPKITPYWRIKTEEDESN
jgi:hypothetical protein